MTTQILTKQISTIEKYIKQVKTAHFLLDAKKHISLKGTLKGVKITPKDIEHAKKSVFKK